MDGILPISSCNRDSRLSTSFPPVIAQPAAIVPSSQREWLPDAAPDRLTRGRSPPWCTTAAVGDVVVDLLTAIGRHLVGLGSARCALHEACQQSCIDPSLWRAEQNFSKVLRCFSMWHPRIHTRAQGPSAGFLGWHDQTNSPRSRLTDCLPGPGSAWSWLCHAGPGNAVPVEVEARASFERAPARLLEGEQLRLHACRRRVVWSPKL